MSSKPMFSPGTFCWADLGTPNAREARSFYTFVFDWDVSNKPIPGDGVYSMLLRHGEAVAALYERPAEHGPPFWLGYIMVENVDQVAGRVPDLDGQVAMGPFDVMDAGRMAIIQDPTGAFVALWQPRGHQGAGVYGAPGSLCWFELMTGDTAGAAAFYEELLGWQAQASTIAEAAGYTEFLVNGTAIGGMLAIPAEAQGMPPAWTPYFAVEDIDETIDFALDREGAIVVPVRHIPGVGQFARLRDPHGACFAVIQPTS